MLLDHGPSRTVDFINHFYDQAGDNVTDSAVTPGDDVAIGTTASTTEDTAARNRAVTNPY